VVSYVDVNVSEKHAVSILRAEVTRQGSREAYIGSKEPRLRAQSPKLRSYVKIS
jgi:hypothetical protein